MLSENCTQILDQHLFLGKMIFFPDWRVVFVVLLLLLFFFCVPFLSFFRLRHLTKVRFSMMARAVLGEGLFGHSRSLWQPGWCSPTPENWLIVYCCWCKWVVAFVFFFFSLVQRSYAYTKSSHCLARVTFSLVGLGEWRMSCPHSRDPSLWSMCNIAWREGQCAQSPLITKPLQIGRSTPRCLPNDLPPSTSLTCKSTAGSTEPDRHLLSLF